MELDKAIKSRTSVRKFNSKKPNWRNIIECIDAARYAPMAGGNYTLKFILVDEPEKINSALIGVSTSGITNIVVTVPTDANTGLTFARFRKGQKPPPTHLNIFR